MLTPFQTRARHVFDGSLFFGAFADDDLRWLNRTSARKGEVLFEQGHQYDALLGLVRGRANLYVGDADERRISLGLVAPGELLGDVGARFGTPRTRSAIALTHCELAMLSIADLEGLFDRKPRLRDAYAEASSNEARALTERIADSALLSVEERVEKALYDLARRFGERIEGQGICIRLRQQDLADVLGLSRESISKVLTSSAMSSRIELGRERIILTDA